MFFVWTDIFYSNILSAGIFFVILFHGQERKRQPTKSLVIRANGEPLLHHVPKAVKVDQLDGFGVQPFPESVQKSRLFLACDHPLVLDVKDVVPVAVENL